MTRSKLEANNTIYIRDVPVEVKTAFKKYCIRNGRTMRWAIIDMIKNVVRGKHPKEGDES